MAAFNNLELNRAQRESEKRYRNISNESLTGIVIHQDFKLVYLNPRMATMLGFRPGDVDRLIGQPFINFIHPDDHNINDAEVEKLSKGEKTIGFENRYICKDGSVRTISWTATPLEKEGLIYPHNL